MEWSSGLVEYMDWSSTKMLVWRWWPEKGGWTPVWVDNYQEVGSDGCPRRLLDWPSMGF